MWQKTMSFTSTQSTVQTLVITGQVTLGKVMAHYIDLRRPTFLLLLYLNLVLVILAQIHRLPVVVSNREI